MKISWTGALCITLLAACAEPQMEEVDETLICWTEEPEMGVSAGKYSSSPKTICVPILYAPTLPKEILARAETRDKSSDGVSRSPGPNRVVRPTANRGEADEPTDLEFSEVHDSGPVAAIKKADNTVEYSVVNRDARIVRAVDDGTVTNSNEAQVRSQKFIDEVFKEVGLAPAN